MEQQNFRLQQELYSFIFIFVFWFQTLLVDNLKWNYAVNMAGSELMLLSNRELGESIEGRLWRHCYVLSVDFLFEQNGRVFTKSYSINESKYDLYRVNNKFMVCFKKRRLNVRIFFLVENCFKEGWNKRNESLCRWKSRPATIQPDNI